MFAELDTLAVQAESHFEHTLAGVEDTLFALSPLLHAAHGEVRDGVRVGGQMVREVGGALEVMVCTLEMTQQAFERQRRAHSVLAGRSDLLLLHLKTLEIETREVAAELCVGVEQGREQVRCMSQQVSQLQQETQQLQQSKTQLEQQHTQLQQETTLLLHQLQQQRAEEEAETLHLREVRLQLDVQQQALNDTEHELETASEDCHELKLETQHVRAALLECQQACHH